MKFNCDFFKEKILDRNRRKYEKSEKWHKWFAWHPVRLGPGDCRWLEYVERRNTWRDGWKDRYPTEPYIVCGEFLTSYLYREESKS